MSYTAFRGLVYHLKVWWMGLGLGWVGWGLRWLRQEHQAPTWAPSLQSNMLGIYEW
jgi:hypothetical protein